MISVPFLVAMQVNKLHEKWPVNVFSFSLSLFGAITRRIKMCTRQSVRICLGTFGTFIFMCVWVCVYPSTIEKVILTFLSTELNIYLHRRTCLYKYTKLCCLVTSNLLRKFLHRICAVHIKFWWVWLTLIMDCSLKFLINQKTNNPTEVIYRMPFKTFMIH